MAAALIPTLRTRRMTSSGAEPLSDDREIVARAQRGDVDAFEALYHGHSGRVFGLCLRMCGDRQRATELLQDVFVRVWERIRTYRGESAFGTWVHRVAANVVLEEQRRTTRQTSKLEDVDDDGYEAVGDRRDSVDERLDLERAIALLSPGMRRVFVLHDIEGYQHNEIAQMTGLAEGTLRAQLHHARKLLMGALNR